MEELKSYDEDTIYHQTIKSFYKTYSRHEGISELMDYAKMHNYWGIEPSIIKKKFNTLTDVMCYDNNSLVVSIIKAIHDQIEIIAYKNIGGSYFEDVGFDISEHPISLGFPLQIGHFVNMRELLYTWKETYTTATFCSGHGLTVNDKASTLTSDIEGAIISHIRELVEVHFNGLYDDVDEIYWTICDCDKSVISDCASMDLTYYIMEEIFNMTIEEFFKSFKFKPIEDLLGIIQERGMAKENISRELNEWEL